MQNAMTNLYLGMASDLEESPVLRYCIAALAFVMMIGMFAVPAQAQAVEDGNPFNDANSDLLRYGTYGLVAGGVIMGVLVGVRAGKSIYKTLSS